MDMSFSARKSSLRDEFLIILTDDSIGTSVLTVGLPILCYLFAFVCNDVSGCPAPSLLHPTSLSLSTLKQQVGWPGFLGLINLEATAGILAYYALSLFLQAFFPGETMEGTTLRSGAKLQYKFNAFESALITLALAGIGTFFQGADFALWTFIWDNFVQLMTINIVIAFALASYVYHRSFTVKAGNHHKRELALGGKTGNMIYDWFIGRELNPRVALPLVGTIDIKAFCELRPGMLGWMLLDLTFAAHQYKVHGYVSDSMIMVVFFQTLYILDALYMEPAILTTMDITTDGFGFMLAFGDLVWLPFIYSLQARYLAVYPVDLGLLGVAGILVVQGLGYYIFRSANNQKNRFRTDPSDPRVSHLEFIKTKAGSKLITSGWWGTARHINYTGDIIMALSYSLPTGISGYIINYNIIRPGAKFLSPEGLRIRTSVTQGEAKGWGMLITYFYVLYFVILLIHRERRDEDKCKRKYGADWEEYTKKVPYRLVPYIY